MINIVRFGRLNLLLALNEGIVKLEESKIELPHKLMLKTNLKPNSECVVTEVKYGFQIHNIDSYYLLH